MISVYYPLFFFNAYFGNGWGLCRMLVLETIKTILCEGRSVLELAQVWDVINNAYFSMLVDRYHGHAPLFCFIIRYCMIFVILLG